MAGKQGDDLSVASVSKLGKSTHRVKSSRRGDFEEDFLSDEEGGMDMTIRGNTQRNPQKNVAVKKPPARGGRTNRTEKSEAAVSLSKMKKLSWNLHCYSFEA